MIVLAASTWAGSFVGVLRAQSISAQSSSLFPSPRYSLPCRNILSAPASLSSDVLGKRFVGCRRLRGGEGQWSQGKVPEEDKTDPPRAAQGSHHLPWDRVSIPTKAVCLPGAGGWDGGLVFARVAGGGFRHGVTTSATVESLNVCRNCGVGRRPSGSTSAVRAFTPWNSSRAVRARSSSTTSRRRSSAVRAAAPVCIRSSWPSAVTSVWSRSPARRGTRNRKGLSRGACGT